MLTNIKFEIETHTFENHFEIDVLRLDKVHNIVSGNKYFKLYYYIQDALIQKSEGILTFGGGFSNHLVATAFYAHKMDLKSIGYVKGDYSKELTTTLLDCKHYGMQLQFLSKQEYNNFKRTQVGLLHTLKKNFYLIPEGGYGILGMQGICDLFQSFQLEKYHYIVLSVGTGTTLAGIVKAFDKKNKKIIGFVPMKNNESLYSEIFDLLQNSNESFELNHQYHFGGFGKKSIEVNNFIEKKNIENGLPLDKIYTAKAMMGCLDLFKKGFFKTKDNILFVHTGGLQGNQDTLKFF